LCYNDPMKTLNEWFSEYGESHQNRTNKIIHKICVPLITWSLLGILWTIPVPDLFISFGLNWAHLFLALALVFYASLKSLKVIGVFALLAIPACVFFKLTWPLIGYKLFTGSILVFVLAWIGQFIGHKIEGKKPSFFKDLQFLLIGPIWVFSDIIRFSK